MAPRGAEREEEEEGDLEPSRRPKERPGCKSRPGAWHTGLLTGLIMPLGEGLPWKQWSTVMGSSVLPRVLGPPGRRAEQPRVGSREKCPVHLQPSWALSRSTACGSPGRVAPFLAGVAVSKGWARLL